MPAKGLRIKLNRRGVLALLSSEEIQADLTARGSRIAAAAGDGFEVETTRNRDRAVVFVRSETAAARAAEAENRALTRAVDAGR